MSKACSAGPDLYTNAGDQTQGCAMSSLLTELSPPEPPPYNDLQV